DKRIERLAFKFFHCHVNDFAVTIEVVHGDYIRMGKRLRLSCFALQGDERPGVGFKFITEDFYGYIRIPILSLLLSPVERAKYDSHTPCSERAVDDKAIVNY